MIGDSLLHYRIVRELGRGGMGAVYLAEDRELGREVALKVLPKEVAHDPARLQRFKQEARAIAALNHPSIVTIYSVEVAGDTHFITMELVRGHPLTEAIPPEGLPIQRVLKLGERLCDAVGAAHRKGITHRDLKPDNVMIDEQGGLKVLDFGIAKIEQAAQADGDETAVTVTIPAPLTAEGGLVGTVAYMSPEQAQGKPVGPASDVFSLGIVLYEMATGKRPFEGDNNLSILTSIMRDSPEPASGSGHRIPSVFDHVIARCLQKDPADRYETADGLRDDLCTLLGRVSPEAVSRRRRVRVGVAVSAVLTLAVVAAGVWVSRQSGRERWARTEALPSIQRLVDSTPGTGGLGFWEAYRLGREAERHIADDPLLAELRDRYSDPVTVHTDPPGARVYARPYGSEEQEWELLGTSPIDDLDFVKGIIALKIELEGYETVHDIHWSAVYGSESRSYVLSEEGSLPEGMIRVAASNPAVGSNSAYSGLHMPGLEHHPRQEPGSFYMDRYEVTNREYKRFVDAGGYESPEFWPEPFVRDGATLTWEEAMASFLDSTGLPGPAYWEVGDYPDGQDEYPVSGISWYEAAAYAEFVGKDLPTIYHWNRVAFPWAISDIVPASNVGSTGPVAVGSSGGANRFGTYDLAGNVREWCRNESSRGGRFILGGGWTDPAYAFVDAYAQSAWDRSITNGFRCIAYEGDSADRVALERVIELPFRDLLHEPAVSDEIFAMYLNQFSYDPAPLNAVIESTLEEEDYVRQKISFDAAYGGERMFAYLFLPRNGTAPYQTVVVFPGSGSLHARSSESLGPPGSEFVVKSGRAVLVPVYKSTYERGDGLNSVTPNESATFRDHVIMWGKDLQRSVDYLQTRDDIDGDRLAYLGLSWGAAMGPIMLAVEDRFRAAVVVVAGMHFQRALPEVSEGNYITRVTLPILIMNGKYDFFFPYETSQVPFYELLGTPEEHKRFVVDETSHTVRRVELVRESLAWLDRYLGTVGE